MVAALEGLDAVIDASNTTAADRDEAVAFFGRRPEATQGLVDLARRTRAARGTSIRLVPAWSGLFGPDVAGDVLLPGRDARIAPTTFYDWLACRDVASAASRPL